MNNHRTITTELGNITGLPWKAEDLRKDGTCHILKSEGDPRLVFDRIALVYDHHTSATAYPTACLMAAAPELLACLKEALEMCKDMDFDFHESEQDGDPLGNWRAAIAKATGGVR